MTEDEKKAKLNLYANTCANYGDVVLQAELLEKSAKELKEKALALLFEIKAEQ